MPYLYANFDPLLNSEDDPLAYVTNYEDTTTFGADRWKTGGGIQIGSADEQGLFSYAHKGHGVGEGEGRDLDGTVDRAKAPPPELWPLLYAIKMQCSSYNIDLHGCFVEAGGNGFGTIPTTKFASALVVNLHRMGLTDANQRGGTSKTVAIICRRSFEC